LAQQPKVKCKNWGGNLEVPPRPNRLIQPVEALSRTLKERRDYNYHYPKGVPREKENARVSDDVGKKKFSM